VPEKKTFFLLGTTTNRHGEKEKVGEQESGLSGRPPFTGEPYSRLGGEGGGNQAIKGSKLLCDLGTLRNKIPWREP